MEAKTFKGMWKAIVFLTTVATVLFSCSACEPEEVPVVYEPSLTLTVENVTEQSAALIAEAQAGNQNVTVIFEYFKDNQWQQLTGGAVSGTAKTIVKQDLTSLNPETTYKVRGYLKDTQGVVIASPELSFQTLKGAVLTYTSATIDLTSINLKLELTPYTDTKVLITYQGKGMGSKTITSPVYNGDKLIPLEFKLENLEKGTVYTVSIKTDEPNSTPIELSLETYAVSDYDGNLYHLVTIGTQTFIKENLKTTHFLNGDPIPHVTNDDQWIILTTPAYCYYNNDPEMGKKYGALYNWYVASDPRGLIEGFHVPIIEEYERLKIFLGENPGGKMKTTTSDWKQPNGGATNSSGFSALPSGVRGGYDEVNKQAVAHGRFEGVGEVIFFWTSGIEAALPQAAYAPNCSYYAGSFSVIGLNSRWKGQSIRLVKN